MKKVWIVGVNGHVGSALAQMFQQTTEYQLLETDIDEVDVTDSKQVAQFIHMNRPDVVINCSGVTDPAKCEENQDLAYAVNALGARNLAAALERNEGKLIQISTDDVFDAHSERPYTEFDDTHPINVYGKSKYAGEKMIESLCKKHVIIRSSWVYGIGYDFLNTVMDAVKSGEELKVPVNRFATPTSATELAKVIKEFVDNDLYGIYHAVCQGSCSRYEFAQEILKCLGKEAKIVPVGEDEGVAASYSVLDNMMLRLEGLEEPKEWKEALREYLDRTGGDE